MELLEIKDCALSFLKASNREVLKWFQGDFEVDLKSDQSPVTIADQNAEEILRKKISRAFPHHGIIGEEFGNENPKAEWTWTIDPIDGTRSFIRGLPLFATLLSLLHKGQPVIGIICLPALGEIAWAVKGEGAFCGNKKLRVSPQTDLGQALVATGDRYCFKMQKQMRLFDRLSKDAGMLRTYPDAFGHLMAIQGSVDIMVDPLAYIWDYAPCKILAKEAGGRFENFTGKRGDLTEGTALVGNPTLVKKLQSMTKDEKRKK